MLERIPSEAWIALAALLCGGWLALRLSSWWRGWLSSRRSRRGHAREGQAERLLKKAGFRVVERHARRRYEADVDGEATEVELIADYLVKGRGGVQVAEVKTGALCSHFSHAATRRQLLEYQLAFGGTGIVLVDMEERVVRQVRFPF